MKKLVFFLGFLGLCTTIVGMVVHFYTITQVWGSGFWTTVLTIVGVGLADVYWAYQWWHGLGWNYSTLVFVSAILYILLRVANKILAVVLEIEEE